MNNKVKFVEAGVYVIHRMPRARPGYYRVVLSLGYRCLAGVELRVMETAHPEHHKNGC